MFTKIKCLFVLLAVLSLSLPASGKEKYPPLRVGCSIGFNAVDYNRLKTMKEAGIDCIEISLGAGIFTHKEKSDEEITARMKRARQAADSAGVEIWSIHMPFGKEIDLSQSDETIRQSTVALQRRILRFCKILQPRVILFHPSWYLGLNERPKRIVQLLRSVNELNPLVKEAGAIMVIENMLGHELLRNEKYERPLCRTVEEVELIMKQMPSDVYSAVDMNHIDNPERLIEAMGNRVKTLHVSDGNGRAECHYMPNPYSGKGDNDWNLIQQALYNAEYTGPFMYEVNSKEYNNPQELYECYQMLYRAFIESIQQKQ